MELYEVAWFFIGLITGIILLKVAERDWLSEFLKNARIQDPENDNEKL